jgi:hypothetical protein
VHSGLHWPYVALHCLLKSIYETPGIEETQALQAYLGHRNIQHMARYTELLPTDGTRRGRRDYS